MRSFSIIAGALLAAAPAARAAQAVIHNSCNFPVYLWSVDCDGMSPPTVVAPGGVYTEQYKTPKSGGVSIKLSKDKNPAPPVTQFEYTLIGPIWYDLSNVDCKGAECPFMEHGMYLESGPGCPTRSCAPGETPCKGVYTLWNDDHNTLSCDAKADVRANLCSPKPHPSWGKRSIEEPEAKEAAPSRVKRHLHAHAHAHQMS